VMEEADGKRKDRSVRSKKTTPGGSIQRGLLNESTLMVDAPPPIVESAPDSWPTSKPALVRPRRSGACRTSRASPIRLAGRCTDPAVGRDRRGVHQSDVERGKNKRVEEELESNMNRAQETDDASTSVAHRLARILIRRRILAAQSKLRYEIARNERIIVRTIQPPRPRAEHDTTRSPRPPIAGGRRTRRHEARRHRGPNGR